MARYLRITLATLCLSVCVALPALAQSSKPPPTQTALSVRLAEARSNPALGESLFKTGRQVASFCANCHGEGGVSSKPDIPNLAGQNPGYLLGQIQKFADGRRRFEFMEGLIKAMSTDEKVGIVLFYASQTVPKKPASNPTLAAQGKDYFNSSCFRCHGADGMGNETFARLAGQRADYLKTTLQHYKNATGGRTDPLMAANTKLMTDANMDAVIAYISSL